MDFVLMLHSHLPYVLNHGRWPHGSDWICEAAIDTYLPLLASLRALEDGGVPAPVTVGFTPVLANQLVSPTFHEELEAYFTQRLEACREAPESLKGTGDDHLIPLVPYWEARLTALRGLFLEIGGDLVGAFRELQERGRIEIVGGAATHGFLPLLQREESIRLQLAVGRQEHRRLFGVDPVGCWLPECAYRPPGWWDPAPGISRGGFRRGIEEYLADEGLLYFFTDAHMVEAGSPLGAYGDVPLGTERFHRERHDPSGSAASWVVNRSPYQAYQVSDESTPVPVAALVRDPRSSLQVWSREMGYPGDPWYLEFHKIRWPGGLRFWRVTGSTVDLGGKRPYDPGSAAEAARTHARHFAGLLSGVARDQGGRGGIVAPFDTELFGHWWHEGVDFVEELYRALQGRGELNPVAAREHLEASPPSVALRLSQGSWGRAGDYSMWLNHETRWSWERLWPLEETFWRLAPGALASAELRPVLAAAARQLLLAQSSDWQFMISTGAVPDYAVKRLNLHVDDGFGLLSGLEEGASAEKREEVRRLAAELDQRDALFPDVLVGVERALSFRTPGA